MPLTNTFEYQSYLSSLRTYKPKIKQHQQIDINRTSLNDSKTDYGKTASHRNLNFLANEKHIYEIKPDPSYIYIQDPKLREIVLMLIKSEFKRQLHTIDSNVLTHIDHENYSLLFSKNGSVLIDEVIKKKANETKTDVKSIQTDSNIEETVEKIISSKELKQNATQTDSYLFESCANTFLADNKGNEYYLAELYDEQTQVLTKYPQAIKLPTEILRLIKADLVQKPLETSERSYKVVINKYIPGQKPEVARILIRRTELKPTIVLPKIKTSYPSERTKTQLSIMRILPTTSLSPSKKNEKKQI